MRKYIRGCKVRFYHAQYIPWNKKPLKTYMASKACHPNECFDTTPCNGIFPVTRPFLFLAHYPNVLLLCYARVSSPPARVPGKCRCQTQSWIRAQWFYWVQPRVHGPTNPMNVLLLCYATMPLPSPVSEAGTGAKKRNQNRISLFLVYKLSYTHEFLCLNGQAISHTTTTIVCLKISAIYSRFIMYSLSSSCRN